MAPHSSTLAWKIPWTEEPGGCSPWGREESDTTERLHFHFSLSCIGEGNGNPLQCSCLENPRDGGAWWAAIYGVAQSWTRLKRLSSNNSMICFRSSQAENKVSLSMLLLPRKGQLQHLELFLVVRTGSNLWIQWAGATEAAKWPVIHRPDPL